MKKKHIVLSIVGVLALDYLIAKANKTPRIIVKEKLPGNYNAQTLPPFGIYITEDQKNNQALINHELVHWEQYRKTGAILFGLNYLLQKAIYGYDHMPLEIEARETTNEFPECIRNYTSCVRQGTSKTVNHTDFRK